MHEESLLLTVYACILYAKLNVWKCQFPAEYWLPVSLDNPVALLSLYMVYDRYPVEIPECFIYSRTSTYSSTWE